MPAARRWGTAVLLLSLLLVAGPTGAQEPSSEPLTAPDHLAELLPDLVAGQDFIVFGLPRGRLSDEFWNGVMNNPQMELAPRVGKTADDVQFAMAVGGDDPPTGVMAIRVAGVPADDVADAFIEGMYDSVDVDGATFPPTLSIDAETMGTGDVRVIVDTEASTAIVLYPVGESLFLVFAGAYEGPETGQVGAILGALRDQIARARETTTDPPTQRVELADVGIAVTLPGDWRQTLAGLDIGDDVVFFVSPDGFFRYCTFGARRFDGRVTVDFVEDYVARELAEEATMARVDTAVGEAVRSLEQQTDIEFIPGMAATSARYFIPSGDSMLVAGCAAGREDVTDPGEDWRHVVDSIEFIDTGHTMADATLATRDLVCSIVVPQPEREADARRAIKAMNRPGKADVRQEVRRFLRRHGKEVLGSQSPGTMVQVGDLTFSGAWSTRPFTRTDVDRSLKELDGGFQKVRRSVSRLLRWFAGVYGVYEDPAIRRDARRLVDVLYRYGVTGVSGDKVWHWSWLNSDLDVEMRAQGLERCSPSDAGDS